MSNIEQAAKDAEARAKLLSDLAEFGITDKEGTANVPAITDTDTNDQLEAKLKQAKADKKAADKAAKDAEKTEPGPTDGSEIIQGIEVRDPQILRPVELPLVIPTPAGGWKNPNQAEYAKYLNAYAYSNPEKWKIKRATLIKRLVDIGTNPSKLFEFRGADQRLAFRNVTLQGETKNELGQNA